MPEPTPTPIIIVIIDGMVQGVQAPIGTPVYVVDYDVDHTELIEGDLKNPGSGYVELPSGQVAHIYQTHDPLALATEPGDARFIRAYIEEEERGGRRAMSSQNNYPRCDDPGAHGPGCACDGGEPVL